MSQKIHNFQAAHMANPCYTPRDIHLLMANALAYRGGLATYDAYLLSTVILHMWERGGGMFLAAVKYKSLLHSEIYSMHHVNSEELFLQAPLTLRCMELERTEGLR